MLTPQQLFILRFPPYLFISLLIQTTVIYPLLGLFLLSYLNRLCLSAVLGALLSALFLFLIHQLLAKRLISVSKHDYLLICLCGLLVALISSLFIRLFIGSMIVILTILQIQRFIRQMSVFLAPHRYVTKRELSVFILFFAELIILFTLINLLFSVPQNPVIHVSEDIIAGRINIVKPQNIINALYFTVITMTTVGFGDFIPLTYYGKILVITECLTSYIIFGLMIGLIVRGIRYPKPKKRISTHLKYIRKRTK